MMSHVSATFTSKSTAGTSSDIIGPITPYLKQCTSDSEFQAELRASEMFVPPGVKQASYSLESRNFSVYLCSFQDEKFVEFYSRIKILPLFFIESASELDIEDTNWQFMVLFEQTTQLEFIGFCSFYCFFLYPDLQRLRIAQLMVLPPYHRQGHASKLYETIYSYALRNPKIGEITFEDPSDTTDVIRDVCDLHKVCTSNNEIFGGVYSRKRKHSDDSVSKADDLCVSYTKKLNVEKLRTEFKFSPRQAERVYEMCVLYMSGKVPSLPFQNMVKCRIHRLNYVSFADLSDADFAKSAHEAYKSVLLEYLDRLEVLEKKFQ